MFVASAIDHRSYLIVAPSVAKIGTKIISMRKIVFLSHLTNITPLKIFPTLILKYKKCSIKCALGHETKNLGRIIKEMTINYTYIILYTF